MIWGKTILGNLHIRIESYICNMYLCIYIYICIFIYIYVYIHYYIYMYMYVYDIINIIYIYIIYTYVSTSIFLQSISNILEAASPLAAWDLNTLASHGNLMSDPCDPHVAGW